MPRALSDQAPRITILLALLAVGCTGSPVGDPCVPENIPPEGFDSREIYLETSSVQCRTRTCMVFKLAGNPEKIAGTPSCDGLNCVTEAQAQNQVFCACRCSVPEGREANTPLCDCPDGYTCSDGIVQTGGPGVEGGYCVPCITGSDDNRGLESPPFEDCPNEE